MPPRPFPFQFGIGIDVVQTSRLRDLITKETRKDSSANPTSLYKFLRWSLTYKEQDAFWARFGGLKKLYRDEVALGNCAHYLAGRWAAKEAAIKAVKPRRLLMSEIQILSDTKTKEVYAVILDRAVPKRPPKHIREAVKGQLREKRGDPTKSKLTAEIDNLFTDDDAAESSIHPRTEDASSEDGADVIAESGTAEKDVDEQDKTHEAAGIEEEDIPGQIAKISISHDGEYTVAVCLAATEHRLGDVGGAAATQDAKA